MWPGPRRRSVVGAGRMKRASPAPAPSRRTCSRKRSAGPSSTRRNHGDISRSREPEKRRLRRSRARPKSASIRRDTYGHLVDGREPVPRGPQHVDPRARRQHRQTKATHDFHSARPLKRQPSYKQGVRSRLHQSAPTTTTDDTHVYHQSGKNLILERNETREEVIRRVQLERFRRMIERRSSSGNR